MNIVFWLLVVIVLALVWFLLAFAFKGVGAFGLRLFNDAKEEIVGNDEEEKESSRNNAG